MPITSVDFYDGQADVVARAKFVTMVAARDALMPLEIITEIERCLHHRSRRSIHMQVFGTYHGPVAGDMVKSCVWRSGGFLGGHLFPGDLDAVLEDDSSHNIG